MGTSLIFRFRDGQFFLASVPFQDANRIIADWKAFQALGKHGVISHTSPEGTWAVGTEHLMFLHTLNAEQMQQLMAAHQQPQSSPKTTPFFKSGQN